MKVVYKTCIIVLLLSSCATSSVYRLSHEHLERKPGLISLGVWEAGAYFVQLLDDSETSYVFDEAVWTSSYAGTVDYIDIVCSEGDIYRYRWNWDKKIFVWLKTLTLEDGTIMNSFQYYDKLVNQRKAPI